MNVKHIAAAILLFFIGCSKNEPPSALIIQTIKDSDLYLLSKNTKDKTFYKFSTDTLLRGGNSAHNAPKLRTWYNSKAATQLDAQGKVKIPPSFPDSSLIVKEIYNADGSLVLLAILYKLSTAENRGPGEWLWSELDADGTVLIPASQKGTGCAGCHSSVAGYTRMNDAHP